MPLLLFPPLHSQLLKTKSQPVVFYVWTDLVQVYDIELWTDLDNTRTWHSKGFVATSTHWYRLICPLASYCHDRYEYTLKYQLDGQEHWLGFMGQNGTITIVPDVTCLPPTIRSPHLLLESQQDMDEYTTLSIFKKSHDCHVIPLLAITNVHSYMALARKSPCWLVPVSGTSKFDKDDRRWQLLVYLDTEGVTWIWWTRQDAWLHINGAVLELHGLNGSVLMCGTTTRTDEHVLMTLLIPAARSTRISVMDTCLGYCTWNSLGLGVDLASIDRALASLGGGIGYLIIDDGWQVQQDGYLKGFDADVTKFPLGLKRSLSWLKQHHPSLRSIGVWHTLWGSWLGIDPATLGSTYGYSSLGPQPVHLVKQVELFYNDFYQYLAESEVDLVKIDNQGAADEWALDDKHRVWTQYRVAVIKALDRYLHEPPLHSMAMAPCLLDCVKWDTGTLRNSDDFFPDIPDSHPWHIYGNLMNVLWSSCFYSSLDFDMFQTGHSFGQYHAISRAISGGPIYITDHIGRHDPSLLNALVAQTRKGDMEILRCNKPCRPFRDTVLGGKDQDYIGARNTTNGGSVYGYWSMKMDQQEQCIAAAQIPLGHIGYISLGLDKGIYSHDTLGIRLKGYGGCALVNVVPVYSGVACLGLLDKLNGTQAIVYVHSVHEQNTLVIRLSHRGTQCGFLVLGSRKILSATLDGVAIQLQQGDSPLLWLLDMSRIPLEASDSPYFNIELSLVCE